MAETGDIKIRLTFNEPAWAKWWAERSKQIEDNARAMKPFSFSLDADDPARCGYYDYLGAAIDDSVDDAMAAIQEAIDSMVMGSTSYDAARAAKNDEERKRTEIPGWQTWDYENHKDLYTMMCGCSEVDYATCVWLAGQSPEAFEMMGGYTWKQCLDYALAHCPRFAAEQAWRR